MSSYRPDAQLSSYGLVVQGSEVTIRTLSGRSILVLTTESDQSISDLTEYCRRMCASSQTIPEVCVALIWKPPVRMERPAGFNLIPNPIRMEATLSIQRIPSDDDFHDKIQNEMENTGWDRCLSCYDAAPDLDKFDMDRSLNCVRCYPCSLCDNCKVIMNECDDDGQIKTLTVCLQCIEPQEIPLLSEAQAFRRSLVFHEHQNAD